MDKFRIFLIVWGVVNGMVQEFLVAMMDKVLTGSEFIRIIKAGLMSLKFSGINSTDMDKLKLVTTSSEWQSLQFTDGDGAIYAPRELIDMLKINLDKL